MNSPEVTNPDGCGSTKVVSLYNLYATLPEVAVAMQVTVTAVPVSTDDADSVRAGFTEKQVRKH